MEKPISTVRLGNEWLKHIKSKGTATYVAYPLRFLNLNFWGEKELRFVCHSDASKWPSERKLDHVLLELSHEIDLSVHCLGNINSISGSVSESGLRADLEIRHIKNRVSRHTLSMASQVEHRYIGVNGTQYPIYVTDTLYLKQFEYFVANLDNRRMMNNVFDATRTFNKIMEFKEGKSWGGKK